MLLLENVINRNSIISLGYRLRPVCGSAMASNFKNKNEFMTIK